MAPPEQIHVVVNIGDDAEFWGLHVSPDIDSIVYALANRLDTGRGWGLKGETFHCLEEIERYGLPSWFQLGDRDLATHLARTSLLRSGLNLTHAVQSMASALGVKALILPASNDPVRSKIETSSGWLDFQEFFVREHCRPDVRSVTYTGASDARAPAEVIQSIREAKLVIVAPSNPITSIGPILAIRSIRDALRCTQAPVVAISPIINSAAVSGPAGKLMEACGFEVSPGGVARCYHDFLDAIVVDSADSAWAPAIRNTTIGVQVTDILMHDDQHAERLAGFILHENSSLAS